MPDVLCPHECRDESHFRPVKKYANSVADPGAPLFKLPEPEHEFPPCDGQCVSSCSRYIKAGMMRIHLIGCHDLTGEEADQIMANPRVKMIRDILSH